VRAGNPFTEKEVQAIAVQLDKANVIMFVESKGSIYPLDGGPAQMTMKMNLK